MANAAISQSCTTWLNRPELALLYPYISHLSETVGMIARAGCFANDRHLIFAFLSEFAYYQSIGYILFHRYQQLQSLSQSTPPMPLSSLWFCGNVCYEEYPWQFEGRSVAGDGTAASEVCEAASAATVSEEVGSPGNPESQPAPPLCSWTPALTHSLRIAAQHHPLYVCGDSHTLPLAWNVLSYGRRQGGDTSCMAGEAASGTHMPHLLTPRLVTGVKHWHLRQESDFYPKKNFLTAIESIPEGSEVLLVLGEIDCREGILVAVEKARYSTVTEGIAHSIGVFVEVLKKIIAERRIRVGLMLYAH